MSNHVDHDADTTVGTTAGTKESNDALILALMQSSMDCIKLLDRDGRLVMMSENGQCVMEIDDASGILGRFWWDLWPADQGDALRALVAKAAGGEDAYYRGACPTGKGTMKLWDVRAAPVEDSTGDISQVVVVSREVVGAGGQS